MKTKQLILATALCLGFTKSFSQALAAENSIQISGKAKHGYLANVVTDDAKQRLSLMFAKKANNKVKVEVYEFDYDLKPTNQYSDEVEFENARTKYKWFNYRGKDEEKITGVEAEADMMGKVVFKKKEISYKYNWYTGKYEKSVEVLDKMKPKDDDNKKFQFYASYSLDETGEALCLAGVKGSMKEFAKPLQEFKIMKVNSNLDLVKEETVSFQYAMKVVYTGPIRTGAIEENTDETGDWAIVFGAFTNQGYGKFKDPNPTNCLYVRVGRDGAIKDKIQFTTKAGSWKIDGFYEKDGAVYFYGPAKKLKDPEDAYYSLTDNPQMMEKGFSCFQVAGVKNSKFLFVNAPNLDEFEAKSAKPDNQKKNVLYEGKKINIGGLDITSPGELFINAQEYSYDAAGSYRGYKYHDFLMLHFDQGGNLVKSYGIDNPQKLGWKGAVDPHQDPKYYPTESVIFEGKDKSSVYWMQFFIGNIERRQAEYGAYKYTWWTPRKQVRIGKIEAASGKVNNFNTFGDGSQGGKKFYLMNEFPAVKINGGKQTVFIGEDTNIWGMDSSGDYLWLGKFDPEKM